MARPRNKTAKLLFLTEFYPQNQQLVFTGGVEARTYYLSQKAKKDYQVEVIFSTSTKIAATSASIFSRLKYILTAFSKALKKDFDLIEASNTTTYLPAFFAGLIKKKPKIAWVPDLVDQDWFQFNKLVGLFGYYLERFSLKLPWDHLIALSQSTKTKLINLGINPQKISIAYGGYEPDEFKKKKAVKYSSFTIITVARLVKTKRIEDLIKAFRVVLKNQPKAQLVIIGKGPQKNDLVKLSSQLGVNDKILFQADLTREQLINLLQKSHLFCLPSVVEGFGLVTIEAMAAGLPAVLVDLPVNREITHNGQGVFFYPPTDINRLASKIISLMTDKKLFSQKQHEAAQLISGYTWDKIYQATNKAYQKFT